jgi:hypothetical protein
MTEFPHRVRLVEGVMDPAEGRIVIHGHLYEASPFLSGTLARDSAEPVIKTIAAEYSIELGDALILFHGLCVTKFTIDSSGCVTKPHFIVKRVKRFPGDGPRLEEVCYSRMYRD